MKIAAGDGMEATHVSLPQRMLEILEGLLRIPAGDLQVTLIHACDLIAAATGADKIDAFLYDAGRDSLVALGTSNQPLSALQRKLGLDVLPVSNGGRSVQVYQTGKVFLHGDVQNDAGELKGLKEALGVRSHLGVPFDVGGERRGVLLAASLKPDFFTEEDARMAETVTRWVGLVAHRAELAEAIRENATRQGRRAGAEELMTTLAHDLRNFLSPMRVRLEILRHRARGGPQEGIHDDLDSMDRAISRIETLVTDILDVARIDRGMFGLRTTSVDLGQLAREVSSLLDTPDNRIQLSTQQGEPVSVIGDPARLRQCLENLVANAIQKSPKGVAVTVAVAKEVQANGVAQAVVEVIDEGPGIPEEMLPHLFERFVTGRVREGGLGLGLYLAKRIAEAHGGDLAARSEPGKGARFTLKLPAAADQGSR